MSNKPTIVKFIGPNPSTEVITIGRFTDNLVNNVTFEFNRYIGDIDLAQFYCMLHIENLGATLLQTKVSGSKLQAVLTVTTDITNFPGTHTSSIKFVRDADNLQYVWTTRNFDLIVERRVDSDKEIQHIDPTPLAGFIINLAANTERINDLEESKLNKPQEIQAGTFPKVTINQYGLVTEGHNLSSEDIPDIPASKVEDLPAALEKLAGIADNATKVEPSAIRGNIVVDGVEITVFDKTWIPGLLEAVIEGYFFEGQFYADELHEELLTPEDSKIYVDKTTAIAYRWGGTVYAPIGSSLALGETSSTAYPGDKGKFAYEHANSPHAPVNAQENVIEGITVNLRPITPINKIVDIQIPDAQTKIIFTSDPVVVPSVNDDIVIYYEQADGLKELKQIKTKKENIIKVFDMPRGFSGDYNDLINKPDLGQPVTQHNLDELAHEDIRQLINLVKDIAEGQINARTFNTKHSLDTWLANPANTATLKIGTHLYIRDITEENYYWTGSGIAVLPEKLRLELATINNDGLMSREDKQTLEGLKATGGEANVIVHIKVNEEELPVDPSDRSVNISVPTKTSDLENDAGFLTLETLPENNGLITFEGSTLLAGTIPYEQLNSTIRKANLVYYDMSLAEPRFFRCINPIIQTWEALNYAAPTPANLYVMSNTGYIYKFFNNQFILVLDESAITVWGYDD